MFFGKEECQGFFNFKLNRCNMDRTAEITELALHPQVGVVGQAGSEKRYKVCV